MIWSTWCDQVTRSSQSDLLGQIKGSKSSRWDKIASTGYKNFQCHQLVKPSTGQIKFS